MGTGSFGRLRNFLVMMGFTSIESVARIERVNLSNSHLKSVELLYCTSICPTATQSELVWGTSGHGPIQTSISDSGSGLSRRLTGWPKCVIATPHPQNAALPYSLPVELLLSPAPRKLGFPSSSLKLRSHGATSSCDQKEPLGHLSQQILAVPTEGGNLKHMCARGSGTGHQPQHQCLYRTFLPTDSSISFYSITFPSYLTNKNDVMKAHNKGPFHSPCLLSAVCTTVDSSCFKISPPLATTTHISLGLLSAGDTSSPVSSQPRSPIPAPPPFRMATYAQ